LPFGVGSLHQQDKVVYRILRQDCLRQALLQNDSADVWFSVRFEAANFPSIFLSDVIIKPTVKKHFPEKNFCSIILNAKKYFEKEKVDTGYL